MPIKFSEKAPRNASQRIRTHLTQTPAATNKGIHLLTGRSNMTIGEAIQIWTIKLSDTDSRPHEVASAGEWKYLIFENEEAVAGAHLSDEAGKEDVSAVSSGPMTAGIIGALNKAENLPEAKDSNLEPRLLIIPSITFTGLWLHNLDNKELDLVIPIPPSILPLEHFNPVPLATLEIEIKKAAEAIKAQIEFMPGDSGGSGGKYEGPSPTDTLVRGVPKLFNLSKLDLNKPVKTPSGGGIVVGLPQFMQYQQQTNWCWSAVGTSVGLLYRTGSWTQCNTASGCLPGQNCCSNPAPCNVYGYLNQSLTYTKSYNRAETGSISINSIVAEIQAGNPVCTRVAWNGGGAHFMAITGVNGNYLTIQDSIYGTSTIAYGSYPSSYQSGGTWTTTYLCKKNALSA